MRWKDCEAGYGFLVVGLRFAAVDGTWKGWEAGGAGWFVVVGLRMVAAFGGTLVDVFSIIVQTSITTWIATWRTPCLHEGLTVHLHLG